LEKQIKFLQWLRDLHKFWKCLEMAISLKVPSGQIRSEWEWYCRGFTRAIYILCIEHLRMLRLSRESNPRAIQTAVYSCRSGSHLCCYSIIAMALFCSSNALCFILLNLDLEFIKGDLCCLIQKFLGGLVWKSSMNNFNFFFYQNGL
jgi:hypothetical protein